MALGLVVAVLILAIDQASKAWVLDLLATTPPPIVLTSFFNLVLTWNQGVSFGIFGGGAVPPLVLSLLSVLIVAFLVGWLRKAQQIWSKIAIGSVIGGAIGNVIDRFVHGAVVDFLDVHVGDYHWPAFNVADSAIVVGVAMLLLESLFVRREAHT
jgi:signal peptidase II